MGLHEHILKDLQTAMKNRDVVRTATLRMVKAALQNALIAQRTADTPLPILADSDVLAILQKEARQRADAAALFRAGQRRDLAEKEEQERAILQAYLPQQLSEEEVRSSIAGVLQEDPSREFGVVMRAVMQRVRGRADGALVQQLVREALL